MPLRIRPLAAVSLLLVAYTGSATAAPPASQPADVRFETVALSPGVPGTIELAYRLGTVAKHPAILMLGALKREVPEWAADLVNEGYMLAAFSVAYPPDPDPNRRPVWLYFDQRFAHSYALGAERAIQDSDRVINYLVSRGDVDRGKIGWLGSSSTGIPGLAVATQGPRLAAVVAFVSTGAYRQWFETWHTNGLWRGEGKDLWPETDALLKKHDPILHASGLYPTALLMVSGGGDKVVDARTARAFVEAARPQYEKDPERLQLVIYDGFGHNLPRDVIKLYAEHWFHLYMHPTRPAPQPASRPADLRESARRTQINAAEHSDVVGAK